MNINNDIWYNNPRTIIDKDKIIQFFPMNYMSYNEKINSLVRLAIIVSLILTILKKDYRYLYIILITLIFTYYFNNSINKNNSDKNIVQHTMNYNEEQDYKNYIDNILNKNKDYGDPKATPTPPYLENNSDKTNLIEAFDNYGSAPVPNDEGKGPCNKPSPSNDNPFMNINLITSNRTQNAAPLSYNKPELKELIDEKFNHDLFRDVSSVFGKRNSQRQFYTVPSTTIPNNQTAFAKWCYNTGSTCKEDTIKCAPYWNPAGL
jgi:hypothetical protein